MHANNQVLPNGAIGPVADSRGYILDIYIRYIPPYQSSQDLISGLSRISGGDKWWASPYPDFRPHSLTQAFDSLNTALVAHRRARGAAVDKQIIILPVPGGKD